MCTLRGVWILDFSSTNSSIIFSRKFRTVENRLSLVYSSNSFQVSLPNDSQFLQLFEEVLKLEKSEGKKVAVSFINDTLWPVVYIEKVKFFSFFSI